MLVREVETSQNGIVKRPFGLVQRARRRVSGERHSADGDVERLPVVEVTPVPQDLPLVESSPERVDCGGLAQSGWRVDDCGALHP